MSSVNLLLDNQGLKSINVNGAQMLVTIEMLKKLGIFNDIDSEFYPSEIDIIFDIEKQQKLLVDIKGNKNTENQSENVIANIMNLKEMLEISKSL